MPRTNRLTAGALLGLAVVAGCRDGAVAALAPMEAPASNAAAPAPMSLAPRGRPTFDLNSALPDSVSVDFFVGPDGGIFSAGKNAVVFPAQSICDPATEKLRAWHVG